MPYWLSVTVAVAMWLWALHLILGTLDSIRRVWGGMLTPRFTKIESMPSGDLQEYAKQCMENKPALVFLEYGLYFRGAITAAASGFLFLFLPWPKVLTYFALVLAARSFADMILCLFSDTARSHAEMAHGFVWPSQDGKWTFLYGIIFTACAYFFGF